MPRLRDIPYTDVPIAHSLEYANASARLAASGLTSSDIGRIARQLDTSEFWFLTAVVPVTWALIGIPASVGSYTHIQSTPSNLWIINHNLGFYPTIEARNSGNVVVSGRVQHTTINQAQVSFNIAISGTARAS